MRPAIRQAKIFDFVLNQGEVRVEDLADRFTASAETIRRDLSVLADAGKLRKIHGGARPLPPTSLRQEDVFEARMRRNAIAKQLIAEKLTTLVSPRQTLFLDTGSTTLICAEAIARIKHLTVITNSTRIAATMAKGSGGADIYLLGGQYRGDNAQTVGPTVIGEIARYRADVAILTIGALDAGGVMDFSYHEAQIARAMIDAALQVTVVADHTKFNRTAAFAVCEHLRIDRLVSDRPPAPPLGITLAAAGVEVL